MHRGLTLVFSLAMGAIGIALVVEAFAAEQPDPRAARACSSPLRRGRLLYRGAKAAGTMSSVAGMRRATARSPPGGSGRSRAPSRPVRCCARRVGSPLLFSIVYLSLASSIYFALGVIAGHALGLTPFVFLVAALMFALTSMTYVEGASLHQERGGSTVFARYAFNELVSFIAGWAILLEYVILIAVTTYSATQYLASSGHARARARRPSAWRSCSSRLSCS